MMDIDKWQVDYAQIRYFLEMKEMFCMKFLVIWPKFHEKTLSRSGDIKIFHPGRRMYMYTLSLIHDQVLS